MKTKKYKIGKSYKGKEVLDGKLSQKILKIAREQQEEFHDKYFQNFQNFSLKAAEDFGLTESSFDSSCDEEYSDLENTDFEEIEIDKSDQDLFEKFLSFEPISRKTIENQIFNKIEGHGSFIGLNNNNKRSNSISLPPKVVDVYTKVGVLLSRYKSGKLPKAFKIIPSLGNWDDILVLTCPEKWSPNACYEATRLFVSNLKSYQFQKFLSTILFDRVREDILENKKLNYHLYMSLKKSIYKPAAFFKGFLFPICESNCTLKEAAIIGSVLSKVSVPVLHSAAALLRLSEMDFSGSTSLFIRILLDKKYALPYKVVDALVFHFMRWKSLQRPLAVLEHQSFLVFVQRYKNDLTPDQKDALLDVIKVKGHEKIGPEVRRELVNSLNRGDVSVEFMET
ncbi:unnamed protein product [Pneumocystis jirovecii]|uniref:Bystin n=2 Tax=Pneumocystis jirovecii TaxID=42068 RepID=L0PEB2_PNEJI|nr:snoRNA-binding rRNA-processing protein ENP1 [Pneumocystis jirovecii RU7]KTW31208.1 hypothetical protein T551_01281 [Pneumocystis jirovecii RU7]CCJ28685.1 unnamed protein product [Pneumocystis jirovecii]CCJ29960.1 unnamed protein product [Pneumocystis jirovecii]